MFGLISVKATLNQGLRVQHFSSFNSNEYIQCLSKYKKTNLKMEEFIVQEHKYQMPCTNENFVLVPCLELEI